MWFNEVDGPIPGLYSALFGIRAEVFREIGQFDPALRHTEDQDYGFRLLQRYEMSGHPGDPRSARSRRHSAHHLPQGVPAHPTRHAAVAALPVPARRRRDRGPRLVERHRAGGRTLAAAAVVARAGGRLAPLAFVLLTIGLDRSMFHHAFASRGVGFGLYFTVVRLLVLLTTAVAAGIGVSSTCSPTAPLSGAAPRRRPPPPVAARQTPRP